MKSWKPSSVIVTCALIVCFFGWAAADAATLTLTQSSGFPGTKVKVAGSGFGANALVDVYLDTTDIRLVVTSTTGTFNTTITIPKATTPDDYWITAVRRSTAPVAAQKPFTVRTNWSQFRGEARHRGINPYENVLNKDNVGGLEPDQNNQRTNTLSGMA
jgi:hypothetical protein